MVWSVTDKSRHGKLSRESASQQRLDDDTLQDDMAEATPDLETKVRARTAVKVVRLSSACWA